MAAFAVAAALVLALWPAVSAAQAGTATAKFSEVPALVSFGFQFGVTNSRAFGWPFVAGLLTVAEAS